MPPGTLVVRIAGPTMPNSFSIRAVRRQVRSKPPPGAAGAMHSGFCGWKRPCWAWAPGTTVAAMVSAAKEARSARRRFGGSAGEQASDGATGAKGTMLSPLVPLTDEVLVPLTDEVRREGLARRRALRGGPGPYGPPRPEQARGRVG